MASIKEKIAGLYIAFFDRAPDQNGLLWWEQQAQTIGEATAIYELSSGFASHEKFRDLYNNLNDNDFVKAIYVNTLGQAGDNEGIEYWTKLIEKGMSRSDMVANFISLSLDFNPDDPQYQNLTHKEIDDALQRQAYIANKTEVALYFVDALSSQTNLNPKTNQYDVYSLDKDPAYMASIKIISQVTYEQSTVKEAIDSLNLIKEKDDAIDILNNIANITVNEITHYLDENAPVFTSSSTANPIDENSGNNQVVYTAVANDESSVTYSLESTDDYSHFNIDSSSGEVTLKDNPDFESKSSYYFTVIATDESGNSSDLNITLDINDLDENASTPSYTNFGLGELSTSDTHGVPALLSGSYWDQDTTTITYSFNTSIPDDYYDYGDGTELTTGWTSLNSNQKNAVNDIFSDLSKIVGISFENIDDNGMIRFNIVDMNAGTDGFAFYPGDNPTYAGDVFLSSAFNSDQNSYGLFRGENGWNTIAHELGHALGLKHPFDDSPTLPTSEDDTNHTIMSYTQRDNYYPSFTVTQTNDGKSIEATSDIIFSQLYSLYDIAALQSILGVNDTTDTGDTIYTLNFSNNKIETIWDAGGEDTLDFSSDKGTTTIDLNPGSLNSVDQYSLDEVINYYQNQVNDADFNDFIHDFITNDLYDKGLLFTGKNDFAISTGTIIENVKTGSGNDTVTDNMVNNQIYTFAGDDNIYIGNGGYDYIDGGNGNDTLHVNLDKNDVDITHLDDSSYNILANDNSFEANLIGIESIQFNDTLYHL